MAMHDRDTRYAFSLYFILVDAGRPDAKAQGLRLLTYTFKDSLRAEEQVHALKPYALRARGIVIVLRRFGLPAAHLTH